MHPKKSRKQPPIIIYTVKSVHIWTRYGNETTRPINKALDWWRSVHFSCFNCCGLFAYLFFFSFDGA